MWNFSNSKDLICVPCIGRQILIHCTTREVWDNCLWKKRLSLTIPKRRACHISQGHMGSTRVSQETEGVKRAWSRVFVLVSVKWKDLLPYWLTGDITAIKDFCLPNVNEGSQNALKTDPADIATTTTSPQRWFLRSSGECKKQGKQENRIGPR